MYHNQAEFILGRNCCFYIKKKKISVSHYTDRLKKENHMIISIDAEKAFDNETLNSNLQ